MSAQRPLTVRFRCVHVPGMESASVGQVEPGAAVGDGVVSGVHPVVSALGCFSEHQR